MIGKAIGIMLRPTATWQEVAEMSDAQMKPLIFYPAILAIIPALAWYYGTSQVGWTITGKSPPVKFTSESAFTIAILFYFAQVVAVWAVGYFIHWMADTYGAESSTTKGLAIAGLCATPILLAGIQGAYPLFWLDFMISLGAISYMVYLLYLGIPIVMRIPQERGFLFASAVVAVGLVMMVIVMASTVILWDLGFAPTFTD